MQKIKLGLDIVNSSKSHNIGIELYLDKLKFFDQTISPGRHHIIYEFNEDEKEHCFKIVMKGKSHEDTKINEDGNIIEDALIDIENISFDDIEIDQLVYNLSQYLHDSNGTESLVTAHKFYGHMGCNGYVELKFSCPLYIWLLENM